ncbi:MAG: tetratricopeptide repeat protein [bacterium]
MRSHVLLTAAGIVLSLFAGGGCQSSAPSPEAGAAAAPTLSPDRAVFAEALAQYGMGIANETVGDYDAALTNFVRAAELDPDNEELHLQLAMALIQKKRYDEALVVMEKISRRRPDSEKALLWLALIYRATDQTDKALQTYQRAMKVAPESSVAYIETASIYSKTDRKADAVKLLERGIGRVEKPGDLYRMLGGIYLQKSPDAGAAADPEMLKKAIRLFEKGVAGNPDDTFLLQQLGDLYITAQQIEKAIVCFEKIEKINPDDLAIKKKLAMSFVAIGDKPRAIATLEEMAEEQPGNARIPFYLGELHEQEGNKTKAIESYKRATKVEVPEPSAFLKLALLLAAEDEDGSIRVLEDGAARFPDDSRLPEMAAYMQLSKGGYEQAMESFAKADKLITDKGGKPLMNNFHLKYVIAMQLAGKTMEAAGQLHKAMGINPAYLDAYMEYILQDARESNIVASVNILNRVGENTPDDPSLFLYIGLLNSYAKLYKAALTAFEKAGQLADESSAKDEILTPVFYFWYAAACERDGQIERAEKMFLKCVELDPDHAEACNYLAYMWAEKGINLDEAMEMVRKALKLDPSSGAYIDTLGWIYFMQGKYDEALKAIGKASEILPDDPTVIEHLGSVYDKLGNPDKALEYWKQSITLDPDNPTLSEKLKGLDVDLKPLLDQADVLKKERDEEDAMTIEEQLALPDNEPEAEPASTNEPPAVAPPAEETIP